MTIPFNPFEVYNIDYVACIPNLLRGVTGLAVVYLSGTGLIRAVDKYCSLMDKFREDEKPSEKSMEALRTKELLDQMNNPFQ